MHVHTEIARTEIRCESQGHATGSRAICSFKTGTKAVQPACSGCLPTRDAESRFWPSTWPMK